MALGSRAMDILLCLLERNGDVVSVQELLSRVWRGVTVDPGALRVQVSKLRKALEDADPRSRYVSNIAGRGYCFVAPISREADIAAPPGPHGRDRRAPPPALGRVVGRDTVIDDLEGLIAASRFVTIVGPGGIGKTTVALALARRLSRHFVGDVVFVDLAVEQGDANVANAVAATLQMTSLGADPVAGVVSQLRWRQMLLVLDSCEHVIGGAASFAEAVCRGAPQTRILATSREPLNAVGEHVYRLAPLEAPPPSPELSFEDVRVYPAAQLFIERVTASGGQIERHAADALLVAEICRKLDGIPLAIEFAAGRVDAFGLATTLALLDGQLRLSWSGRRTAAPRHVTLNAALDWSYKLLSADEARLLRALSTFVGGFTLGAAAYVADDDRDGWVAAHLPGLVAKSLASVDPQSGGFHYRLLDTTRVYAAARLAEAAERDRAAARHAAFSLEVLRDLLEGPKQATSAEQYTAVMSALAEVRSALVWALSERNNLRLGVDLAASAALAMLKTSQFAECRRWAELGLANLQDDQRGSREEMVLQACLGLSRMLPGGNTSNVEAALVRSLELADRLNEPSQMMPVLSGLSLFRHRAGDARQALAFAKRAERVAMALDDATSVAVANDMLATSYHLIGNHPFARRHCTAALRAPPPARGFDHAAFGLEYRNRALSTLARIDWLSGRYDAAVEVARRGVGEAEDLGHPIGHAVVLSGVLPIFLWIGDHKTVSDYIERLRLVAEKHQIKPHLHIGQAFQGIEFVRRGEAERGVRLIGEAFDRLAAGGNRLMRILLGPDYVEGLLEAGDLDAALEEVEGLLRLADETGYHYNLPELLRSKGEVLRRRGGAPDAKPGTLFLRAVTIARRHEALAWAFRSAIALLELRSEEGRPDKAARLVSGLLARFGDSTDTPDRLRAVRLLDKLGRRIAA
ncbi:MAG TPA: winged helix-turn-helix domain-containing protein [Caulobacteraceae bacterium]|nr:winged helix-turn-helix domain-containing protein [Caulobacteraceae bacterium]